MNNYENTFPKKITVDKEIVRILSGSTYESFPKALKELITNSYDADATKVYLTVNLKKQEIIIEDDGVGMDVSDFDFYLRIAGKKRERNETTISGRKRIGQFGVGFLSVFPFCNNYYIESTKKGINEVFFAEIKCGRYFTDNTKSINVEQIPIQGGVTQKPEFKNQSFTKITLSGFSLFGKAFFEEKYKVESRRNTIRTFDSIERLKWELSEDLPIEFPDDTELKKLFPVNEELPFSVYFNNRKKPMTKNIHIKEILDYSNSETFAIGKVKFKYFIGISDKAIKPFEARHLKLRNLNAGVGPRTTFDIGLDGRTYAYLAHISGEIFVEEGLNDLITVSRDKFNFNVDFDSFINFFRKKLRKAAYFLDEKAKINKLEKERSNTKKILSLDNIDTKSISQTRERFEKKKEEFRIKKLEPTSDEKLEINKVVLPELFPQKVVKNQGAPSVKRTNEKIYEFGENRYRVTLDNWEVDSETEFQFGRIEKDILVLNKKHPLLKNKKYSDVFIKFYLICLIEYEKDLIDKSAFISIQNELVQTFKDYK